jgi:hypothetical protein
LAACASRSCGPRSKPTAFGANARAKYATCAAGLTRSLIANRRLTIKTDYDAKVENPELRPFKPGFLDTVYKERATPLGLALTIWRWGRQNPDLLTKGKPLGSYEAWAGWCRDPLLTLGTRDPVERLAAIKAADPKRKRIQTVFGGQYTRICCSRPRTCINP